MSNIPTKADILRDLAAVRDQVYDTAVGLSSEVFHHGTAENWSAANYLGHLVLSVKPVAKAFKIPAERLASMFGETTHAPRSYDEVIQSYQTRIDEGIRAEDYDNVNPSLYRYPEGVTDRHAYLAQTWRETNDALSAAIEALSEAELDRLQMPHPALGPLSLREMLLFTLYHNRLHHNDMQHAASQAH
jgi:hypothetical protein